MAATVCHVCGRVIVADPDGRIRYEGVTDTKTRMWIWGPVPVHDPCRLYVKTPFDTSIGNGKHLPTWEKREETP